MPVCSHTQSPLTCDEVMTAKFCTGCYCHRDISDFPPLASGRERKQCEKCMERGRRAHRQYRAISRLRVRCPCGKTILSTSLRNHKLGVFHRTHAPVD